MRNVKNPLQSTSISLISLIVASAVLTQAPSLHAVITVDESNTVYYDSANNSYFFYYDQNRSQDTNVQGTFLETSSTGSNTLISGYNDGDGTGNTPGDNSYADVGESLTLAQAGSITYGGNNYVAFYLEANQKGKDDGTPGNNYYDITKLQIQTSSSEIITSYDPTAYNASSTNMAYYYDSADNNDETIRLYYGAGNSNWDIVLYVPENSFVLNDTDPNVPDAEETYIQFYVEYHNTAGADYWGYDRGADIIPEPSSTLLVSLGAMIGLLRRRR